MGELPRMAVHLRCWSCDHDLPSPPFSRWQERLAPHEAAAEKVTCGVCSWRYRVEWTEDGWRITAAFRPAASRPASRPRG